MADNELPIDPRTGWRAIAILPSGKVLWPLAGGDGANPPADPPKNDPPAPPPANPPAGDPPADPPPTDPPKNDPPDAAALQRELESARREAAKWRTDHKKLADEKAAAEKAKLTADELKAAELAEKEKAVTDRETRAQERLISASIKEAAAAAGVPAGKLALMPRLIDRESVELDADGEPKNVKALVEALLKEHPEFKGVAGSGSGSADGGHRGKGTLTLEAIKKMTPADINSRWDEVSEFLSRKGAA